jgi:hypothetical protein
MPKFTTETVLNILIGWLQDNINCSTEIIFDNNNTAKLLPHIRTALQDVRDLRHLQLLQQGRTD